MEGLSVEYMLYLEKAATRKWLFERKHELEASIYTEDWAQRETVDHKDVEEYKKVLNRLAELV